MVERLRASEIREFLRLLSLAQQGSQEAWERLFERVEAAVRHQCLSHKPKSLKRRLRDSDLLQEVAIKTHQSLGEFRGKTPQEFIVWVTTITQNLLDDYYRKLHSSKSGAGKEISLENLKEKGDELPARQDQAEADEQRKAKAHEALAQLPELNHRVIELRCNEGLTFEEIGEQLGCSEEAARKRFHRAVQIIREKLKEQE